jgi:HlyD family secretion protein
MLYVRDGGTTNGLTLYGNVDLRSVGLSFRVSGRVKRMLAEEGDRVRAGELLAVLDREPYREKVRRARARLEAARAEHCKLRNGSRRQEIERARARVAEREAGLQNARLRYSRAKRLAKRGAATEQDVDDALAGRKQAAARLEAARQELSLALEGFRKQDVRRAAAEVRAAEASLDMARTGLRDTRLLAPRNGTILTRVVEPGSVVGRGAPVYTLSPKKPVWVRTYVSEPSLGRVRPGMNATVLTDGGRRYRGRIGFISPEAEFTPKTVQTEELRTDLVYRVRVVLPEPDRFLRRGMPVTVRVDAEESEAGDRDHD